MAVRWYDYVKVEGNDWMEEFNPTKNENPIQRGYEQIVPFFLVHCEVRGFQTFPSYLNPQCFCTEMVSSILAAAGCSPLTICLISSIWRPLVTA